MRKIWVIARHEYLVNIRRTGFILMTALVPLLGAITLVVMAFFSGEATNFFQRTFSSEPKKVSVVDASGVFTPILPEFREEFAFTRMMPAPRKHCWMATSQWCWKFLRTTCARVSSKC